jgi:protein-tyrosine phosphatase
MNFKPLWLFNQLKIKLANPAKKFGAATETETVVFGARRPGFPFHKVPDRAVENWIAFMKGQNIQRVLCLLPEKQLIYYNNLLEIYRTAFGETKVCWTPIKDFHLADEQTLINQILPFLAEADRLQEKTVVHCSGGVGRTGHILAAWLVAFWGMSNSEAIEAIKRNGRNARESRSQNLETLLDLARTSFAKPA